MPTSRVRGADLDGLAALVDLLDVLADELDLERRRLRAAIDGLIAVPAVDEIATVAAWAREAAGTARRVAVTLLSDGQDWRAHRGFWDNGGGVFPAFGSGFVDGVEGMGRGVAA